MTGLIEKMRTASVKAVADYRTLVAAVGSGGETPDETEAHRIVTAAGRTVEQFEADCSLVASRFEAVEGLQGVDESQAEVVALRSEAAKIGQQLKSAEEEFQKSTEPLRLRQRELNEQVQAVRSVHSGRPELMRTLNETVSRETMAAFRKASNENANAQDRFREAQIKASESSLMEIDSKIQVCLNRLPEVNESAVDGIMQEIESLEVSKADRQRQYESCLRARDAAAAKLATAEKQLQEWQNFRLADEKPAGFFDADED